jgi:hypothetical protein
VKAAVRPTHSKGAGLLTTASCLLLPLAAAQGYVSFRAQYTFVDHTKHARLPSMLEALGLDSGTVIFALLALSLARRGQRGTVERVLNVTCAFGSTTMNLLAANLNSPRSITVWVLPSALYALASDRLIAVVRRWVQSSNPEARIEDNGSPWRTFGGLALWLVRLLLDAPGTVAGFRRWVLATAPVAPGVRAALPTAVDRRELPAGKGDETAGNTQDHDAEHSDSDHTGQAEPNGRAQSPVRGLPSKERAPGETKREALIRLYERCGDTGDPRYGDRSKAAQLAGEIANQIGYHPGTARRELVRYLATQSASLNGSNPHKQSDPEAVK